MKANKPLNVCMVQHMFFPLWAGPAERFFRYSPGLKERNVILSIMTAMRPGLMRKEVLEGTEIRRVGFPTKSVSAYKVFNTTALLYAIVGKPRPDILLLFGLAPVHIPFLWLVRIFGIKTIFVHTMARQSPSQNRTARTRISNLLHLMILKATNQQVFSTTFMANYLQEIGYGRNNVSIIPNGVNTERFTPVDIITKSDLREALELPADDFIVLFTGIRQERKGVVELVEGWIKYKKSGGKGHLVLVGQEQRERLEFAEFYEKWDKIVAKITEEHQIIIRPASKRIEQYFQAADLFAFLSKHEGMPNVILEAMGCALPIMLTRFDGFSNDYGTHGEQIYITNHDIDQIAADLRLLIENGELRKKLAENGREWVKKNQEIEVVLDKYCDLFNKTVN